MDNEIKRCTGECCEIFFLPFTPKQFKKLRKLKKRKGMHPYIKGNHVINSKSYYQDMDIIMHMIIPISPSLEKLKSHIGESAGKNGNWYTCKHFNQQTRNCDIYNSRPEMCRNFPYGMILENKCYYKKCNGCHNIDSVNYKTPEEYISKVY